MSEEPKNDAKTTADGAASAAPGAAGAKAPPQGGEAVQAAEQAAGKDGDKKEDKVEKKDKDDGRKEDKDGKKGKDGKKDEEKKGKGGDEKSPAQPFRIPESAVLAGVIVASLAAGSLLGTLLIAPQVIAARNARPAAPAVEANGEAQEDAGGEAKGHGKEAGGHGKKGKGEKAAVYRIDNIVVNPAGSAGSRFLMASVAFELPDEKTADDLREQEVQVRDAVISTLESQTLEMLTTPGSREGLKRQLAAVVQPLVPGRKQLRVYLPQFVIQ